MIGRKFGKLFIVNTIPHYVHYVCDCGNFGSTKKVYVTSGQTTSCGCVKASGASRTHSMTDTPEYRTWDSMISRCYRESNKRFHDYGGRGILVCDEWRKFDGFFADMGARPKGMSLDRIDNSKGYYKENCKWSSAKEQMQNRRNSKFVEHNGKTVLLHEVMIAEDISCGCLYWGVNKMKLPLQAAFERALKVRKANPSKSKNYRVGEGE